MKENNHVHIQCDRNYRCIVAAGDIICYSSDYQKCPRYSQLIASQQGADRVSNTRECPVDINTHQQVRGNSNVPQDCDSFIETHLFFSSPVDETNEGWFNWENRHHVHKMTLDDYSGGSDE